MSTTVKVEQIDQLLEDSLITTMKMGEKTLVLQCTLPCGFVITEHSSCVDPAHYDTEVGTKIALDRVKNKLWELEGYLLQNKLAEAV